MKQGQIRLKDLKQSKIKDPKLASKFLVLAVDEKLSKVEVKKWLSSIFPDNKIIKINSKINKKKKIRFSVSLVNKKHFSFKKKMLKEKIMSIRFKII